MKRLYHFVPQASDLRGRNHKIRHLEHAAAGCQCRTYTVRGVLKCPAAIRADTETLRRRDIRFRVGFALPNIIARHEDGEVIFDT